MLYYIKLKAISKIKNIFKTEVDQYEKIPNTPFWLTSDHWVYEARGKSKNNDRKKI